MAVKRNLVIVLCALLLAGPAQAQAQAGEFDLAKLKEGGYVVLLRPVTAGGADAAAFDLSDCRTQPQVGASGRAQAHTLAARVKRSEERRGGKECGSQGRYRW